MLVALVSAPLFHSHDRDDHGHAVSLVHAHLLEDHDVGLHVEDEIEAPPDDHQARWIDFFTFQPAPPVFALELELGEERSAPVLERRAGVVFASAPRAHSPPDGRRSVPRSPPAI